MVLIPCIQSKVVNSCLLSFRPLAGIMVLISATWRTTGAYIAWFPSPCGDYGSYPLPTKKEKDNDIIEVSVPLRGLWFLSWLQLDDNNE